MEVLVYLARPVEIKGVIHRLNVWTDDLITYYAHLGSDDLPVKLADGSIPDWCPLEGYYQGRHAWATDAGGADKWALVSASHEIAPR